MKMFKNSTTHFIHIRMAIIQKKTENNKCRQGGEEIGILAHRWWECETG